MSKGKSSGINSRTEFINNHKFKIGIDFTSLISLMGHQLYVFVMIDLDRRNLISINLTDNPHFEWVKQQFQRWENDLIWASSTLAA